MNTEIALGFVTFVGTIVSIFATYIYNKDKVQAETNLDALRLIIDTLQEEVASLKKERSECEDKIDALRGEIDVLRAGIATLIQQLTQSGIKSNWTPGTGPLIGIDPKTSMRRKF